MERGETFEILTQEANIKSFDAVKLLDKKFGLKIESFACYDDWFILGTSCGRILLNRVHFNNGKFESSVEKVIYKTKKPIQQLGVHKSYEILISLFDSQIHIFNLNTLHLDYSIGKTRGCSMFAFSFCEDLKLLNLCVSRKKHLQFYYLSNHKSQFKELINDLELNETPKNLQLTKDNLVIFSLRKEYFFYALPTKSTEVQKILKQFDLKHNRNFEPLCEKLSNDFFTLSIEDNKTLVYDSKGNLELDFTVLWSNSPVSICALGPYLLGLWKNMVEVLLLEKNNTIAQILEFKLENNEKLKIVSSNGRNVCYLVSEYNLWCLLPVEVNRQLEQCLITKNYALGIELISSHLNYFSDNCKWRSLAKW